jgi:hypothetical protein
LKPTNDSWRLDETYLKVNGEQVYLYRVSDSKGETVDSLLSRTRNKQTAKSLHRKSLEPFGTIEGGMYKGHDPLPTHHDLPHGVDGLVHLLGDQ